jgi:polysaccharide biosynthesis protein PslH
MAKLLVLTSRVCYPPREGHQLRTWYLVRALAREHEVRLLTFARADDAIDEAGPLRDIVASMETFPIAAEHSRVALLQCLLRGLLGRRPFVVEKYRSAAMAARVAHLAQDSDLIHVDMLPLMSALPDTGLRCPVVLNAHNVEHLLLQQRAELESHALRRAFLRSQVPKLERYEIAACRRADQLLACSAVDAAHFAAHVPLTPTSVIANGVDTELNRPDANARRSPTQLVFVGQMGWFPNLDGVRWFLDDIFPRILNVRPDTEFVIVGKSQGLHIPAGVAANVRLAGFVDDVRASIRQAAVYIVPLRAGSGTRLKVLEAMALGMPIVATQIGAEGIALEHERSALLADTAETFATAVLRLLDAPDFAATLAGAARQLAVARYDWKKIGDELLAIYADLLSRHIALRERQR